jgi:hypothetical protein
VGCVVSKMEWGRLGRYNLIIKYGEGWVWGGFAPISRLRRGSQRKIRFRMREMRCRTDGAYFV